MEGSKEGAILHEMMNLYERLLQAKPRERSEQARRYAVTITEYEKMMAYFAAFITGMDDSLSLGVNDNG